jgi:hypothetical protein
MRDESALAGVEPISAEELSAQDQLDALREEISGLQTQMTRVALLSLATLFLLWTAVTRAHRVLINETTKDQVYRHEELKLATEAGALPTIYDFYRDEILAGYPPLQLDRLAQHDSVRKIRIAARDAIRDSLDRAATSARQQLTVDYSVAGLKIPLNLVEIGVALPLAFLVSVMYLLVQRAKIRLLLTEGNLIVRSARRSGILSRDLLIFSYSGSSPPPYSSHPALLLQCVYVGTAGLIMYTLYEIVSKPVLAGIRMGVQGHGISFLLLLVPFIAVLFYIAYYSWLYSWHSRRAIAGELSRSGVGSEPRPIERIVMWVDRVVDRFRTRRRARGSIMSGSTLVIVTLLLPIATTSSCMREPQPRTGWQFATGQDDAVWQGATLLFTTDEWHSLLGRGMYIVALATAAGAFVYLIASRYLKAMHASTFGAVLLWLCASPFLFVIGEMSFDLGIFRDEVGTLRKALWVVPLILWFTAASYRMNTRRLRWGKVRSLLIVGSLPLLAYVGVTVLLQLYARNPLAIYVIGVGLLMLGLYLELTRTRGEELRALPRASSVSKMPR